MSTSFCAYCGGLAENPEQLNWVIPSVAGQDALTIRLPLCVECSQSWCLPVTPCAVVCPEGDAR